MAAAKVFQFRALHGAGPGSQLHILGTRKSLVSLLMLALGKYDDARSVTMWEFSGSEPPRELDDLIHALIDGRAACWPAAPAFEQERRK
jgi:hypothetical protein